MASTLFRFESSGILPAWTFKNPLVYAAAVDNEEALHHRILDACQTIRNRPGNFEQMQRSMVRPVEAFIESHERHFEILSSYKCNLQLSLLLLLLLLLMALQPFVRLWTLFQFLDHKYIR
jgi:hypothetical protein